MSRPPDAEWQISAGSLGLATSRCSGCRVPVVTLQQLRSRSGASCLASATRTQRLDLGAWTRVRSGGPGPARGQAPSSSSEYGLCISDSRLPHQSPRTHAYEYYSQHCALLPGPAVHPRYSRLMPLLPSRGLVDIAGAQCTAWSYACQSVNPWASRICRAHLAVTSLGCEVKVVLLQTGRGDLCQYNEHAVGGLETAEPPIR